MSLSTELCLRRDEEPTPQEIRGCILKLLEEVRVMTLATCVQDVPWTCTVAFAYDENLNLYFISNAQTRHAQEIAQNPRVAVAMHEHQNPYDPRKVKGLQLQGRAEALLGQEAVRALVTYIRRFPKARALAIRKLMELQTAQIFRVKPERVLILDKGELKARVEYLME